MSLEYILTVAREVGLLDKNNNPFKISEHRVESFFAILKEHGKINE